MRPREDDHWAHLAGLTNRRHGALDLSMSLWLCVCSVLWVFSCLFYKSNVCSLLNNQKRQFHCPELIGCKWQKLSSNSLINRCLGHLTSSFCSMMALRTARSKAQRTCPGSITPIISSTSLTLWASYILTYCPPLSAGNRGGQPPRSHIFPFRNSRVTRQVPFPQSAYQAKKN